MKFARYFIGLTKVAVGILENLFHCGKIKLYYAKAEMCDAGDPAVGSNMKQDYTLDELQTEMTALAQLFDSVTLADPRMGLLDATLQPLNKVAAMPGWTPQAAG